MINLLPTSLKDDLTYARHNTTLRKWVLILTGVFVGVGVITVAGNYYLNRSINNLQTKISSNQQLLKKQDLEGIKAELTDISSNTKLAVDVLSQEILFSKLLRELGSALPANTVLQTLSVDSLEGALQLQAQATDVNAATQLQVNLSDPQNGVFEAADIESIACEPSETNTQYPCQVQLTALLAENSEFLFIDKGNEPAAKIEANQ